MPPQSTTSTPQSQAGTKSKPKPKPSAPPISIQPTQFARIYALLHPAILLTTLVLRFGSLIDDPVAELLGDLPYLIVAQIVFVMGCLPPASGAGDADAEEKGARKTGGTRRRIGAGAGRGSASGSAVSGLWGVISSKLTPALLSTLLTTLLATPTLSIPLILFGAPITTHHALTLLCATHMAFLSCLPLIYVHGVDGSAWREIWGAARPADVVWGGALGTCLGAWFGAVPIPLDWDRPWQAYPITILTGAYVGYAVGMLLGRSRWLFGKRIEFDFGKKAEGDLKAD